jgi:uncharacterized protein YjbJ (UPF0337 family)
LNRSSPRSLLLETSKAKEVAQLDGRTYLVRGFPKRWRRIMDKDRIAGSAKQVKGAVKQVVGKAVGDAKLESEGKADKMEGKVQNAIGGLKDTLRGK